MTVELYDTEDTLAETLAGRIASRITEQRPLVLGLPTGRTAAALYARLVACSRHERCDWSRVWTFNLDEFAGLGGDMPGSYRAFMQRELFAHISIDPDHIGFLDGRAADLDAECRRYETAIAAAGGIDIMILGIGANGHIGFNEPAAHLRAHTHRARLQPSTRAANAGLFGGDVTRVPADALSMGMATILHARAIVLMATGGEKAHAVEAALHGGVTTHVPASFLQLHPAVTVMLDRAASRRAVP